MRAASGLLLAAATAAAMPGAADGADAGRELYAAYCARCHGRDMVTSGTGGLDLRDFPADQRDRFETSVVEGTGLMPAWGSVLSAEQVAALWAYVSGD